MAIPPETNTRYSDAADRSLAVPDGLPMTEYETVKTETYARAIEAWNALDGSGRQRIVVPSSMRVSLITPPSSEKNDSQDLAAVDNRTAAREEDAVSPLRINQKWGLDDML